MESTFLSSVYFRRTMASSFLFIFREITVDL